MTAKGSDSRRLVREGCPACGEPLRATTAADDWGDKQSKDIRAWWFVIKVRQCVNAECPAKPDTELWGTLRLTAAANVLGFLVDALLRIEEFTVKGPADKLMDAIKAVEAKDVTPKGGQN